MTNYLKPFSEPSFLTEIFFINADQASDITLPATRCINFLSPSLRKPQFQEINDEMRRYVINCAFDLAYLYENTQEALVFENRLVEYPPSIKTSLSAIMLTWDKISPIKNWQWNLVLMAAVRNSIVSENISVMQILNPSKNGIKKLSNPLIAGQIQEGALTVERVLFMSKNEFNRIMDKNDIAQYGYRAFRCW